MIPILGFDDTVIAYYEEMSGAGTEFRIDPYSMAWYYKENNEITSYIVQEISVQRVDSGIGRERAMIRLSDRIRNAERDKIPNLQKATAKITASLEFMNQELELKGPNLSIPLALLNDFVGYLEGDKLVRVTSSRYNIAKGSDSSGDFEPLIGEFAPIQFTQKTIQIEDSLRTNLILAQNNLERLRHDLELWKKNLEIIEKGTFRPPQ